MIGINFAGVGGLAARGAVEIPLKSTTPYVYPWPPDETTILSIELFTTSIITLPLDPSPTILNSCPVISGYPLPGLSIHTFLIWLLFTSESEFSLTDTIWESDVLDQSLGRGIYSVESNFIISLGET